MESHLGKRGTEALRGYFKIGSKLKRNFHYDSSVHEYNFRYLKDFLIELIGYLEIYQLVNLLTLCSH